MKYIKLTKGYKTKVDNDDFEKFNKFKWQSNISYDVRVVRFIRINKKRKIIFLSREIMNAFKEKWVDHINKNSLDNRKCNLRLCTNSTNQANRGKQKNNTSGYKGVIFFKNTSNKKWLSQIQFNNKYIYLGCFEDKKEAAKAYDKKAKELFGKFAIINFKQKL